jgi:very-short-patch-repair endonuclease
MDDTTIDYTNRTKIELIALCKERNIRGHSSGDRTKEKIIELIKEKDLIKESMTEDYNNMKYETILALCKERKIKGYFGRSSTGKVIATKEMMIKSLEENIVRKSLFDYLTENNPIILTKYVGNIDDLKNINYGTNTTYTWKCDNSDCSNTFKAIPGTIYKTDLPRMYCNSCSKINKEEKSQIKYLERSGSIQIKIPNIIEIWSKNNTIEPSNLSSGSNKNVILLCPNKNTKHLEYKIKVNKIQEHNCFRCPKCITKTSNAEMRIYSELKYIFKDVKWQQKIEGREADIIIEDLKLVIEVDGYPWHKNKLEKDLFKNTIFEKNKYSVLRIRDLKLQDILCNNIICNITNFLLTDYNKIIDWINDTFKYNINKYNEWKNTEYYKEIQVSRMSVKYEDSIEYIFPESKSIWDYEKNYPFIPSQFSRGSCMEIYLKCNNNHSWKRRLGHLFRTIKDKKYIMKCPECYKSK